MTDLDSYCLLSSLLLASGVEARLTKSKIKVLLPIFLLFFLAVNQ